MALGIRPQNWVIESPDTPSLHYCPLKNWAFNKSYSIIAIIFTLYLDIEDASFLHDTYNTTQFLTFDAFEFMALLY